MQFCRKHRFWWIKYGPDSRCGECLKYDQDEYDLKHNVINYGGKRQCGRCKLFKNTWSNFSVNKKRIVGHICYRCQERIKKLQQVTLKHQIEGQLQALINILDGKHNNRVKIRAVRRTSTGEDRANAIGESESNRSDCPGSD